MKPAPVNSDLPPEERGNGLSERQWIIIGAVAFAAAILLGLLIPGKKAPGTLQGDSKETPQGGPEQPQSHRSSRRKGKTAEGIKTEKKEGSHEEK